MEKIKKILEKRNAKIILVALLLLITMIIFFISLPKANKEEKEKKIISEDSGIHFHKEKEIVKEEKYEGIKFSNISMVTKGEYTTFSADVTNESKQDIEKERLHISLKDKEGKEIIKLLVYIPKGLKIGETKNITASAKGEFNEVVSKEIVE